MVLETEAYKIIIDTELHTFTASIPWSRYSSSFLVVDENTQEHCSAILYKHIPVEVNLIIIPPGEQHKSLSTCQYIWKQLVDKGADRKSLMLNLGGGVLGDLAGYCASCYMRGIDFVQIPTTLLSQVDASVGGKLGIDFMQFKNMIGVFNDPELVYIFPGFLKTLSKRELVSGFAEVVKHAIIHDSSLWHFLKTEISDLSSENINWEKLIFDAVKIKYEVVSQDPYEQSVRKILNFGHSVGHAIESESFHTIYPLAHGEAIAIGMICESYISCQQGMLTKSALEEISAYILHHFPKQELGNMDSIITRMKGDKKNVKGKKLIACPDQIGNCVYDIEVSDSEVREALNYYQGLQV